MQIANRYHVIEKVGQGGMGAVYKVYDRLTQTKVALKQVLIPKNQLDFASKAGTDDTNKPRLSLAQEFSILATLRHPHILSVLDFGFDEKQYPYYVMTLIEGGQDIRSYAKGKSVEEKFNLLAQMLQALHYLHRRGILHRDLKPDNVLIDQDGQVKVMDFGLAKKESTDSFQSTKDSIITGTIMYMSPELFQDEKASVSSDLFAFGLMAYEILVGKYPFEFNNIASLIMNLMTATPDTIMLSSKLADWLDQLLSKAPNERPQSAYDALQSLYETQNLTMPAETQLIRESFLQASEFIGRTAELTQLINGLEQTSDDASAFFLVGGESGVGKSRLLDELRIEALVRNALVMRGQGVEGGGLPFQLWRDIVRRMLLVVEVTDLQAGILKEIVPDIDGLLQRDIAKAPELTDKAYQDRMILSIVDLFRKLPQPIVLLLEDVQWTSESLVVLEQMLKVPEQLPKLMVVANYRDDESPDLDNKLAGMTHIKLERLTADAVSQLSSAMLGAVGMNEDVVKLLHTQSEGNVFFLVETVRALAEASGELERIGQGELPEGVFTGGMQAITRRHLSKVDEQFSDIQTLAAVIGREIDTQLLAYAHDEASVNTWLSNADDYNVVSIQDNVWRFAHDKLRETLIADIPDDALPQIHRIAAKTIEAVYPDDDSYNETLMRHWHTSGELDKELQYLNLVAKNMIEIWGTYSTANNLLQDVLKRLAVEDARRVPILNWLTRAHINLGNYPDAIRYAKNAQQIAEQVDDERGLARSLSDLGYVAMDQGEYERATDLNQQSLAIQQGLGDQHGIAKCLNDMGIIAVYQGEYERATDLYQQSMAIKQELGNQQGVATSLNNLGVIAVYQGEYERAIDPHQRSLTIMRELGDQRGIATSLNNMGVIARGQGEHERATDLYQESLAIRRKLGDQQGVAASLNNLGVIAQEQGEHERAIDLYQQSLAIRRKLGDQRGIAASLGNLGVIAQRQGEYERATDLHQQNLAIRQELGDQQGVAASLSNIGWIMLKQGNYKAAKLLHKGLTISNEINILGLSLYFVVSFGSILIYKEQMQRAAELLGFVQAHPLQSDLQKRIKEIMPQLEKALSPDELQAGLERGAALNLETVVQELLDEFGEAEAD